VTNAVEAAMALSIDSFLEFARSKPADDVFEYANVHTCAIGQYMDAATGRRFSSVVSGQYVYADGEHVPIPLDVREVLHVTCWIGMNDAGTTRWGTLVEALEKQRSSN
jgi:hypothetical protein